MVYTRVVSGTCCCQDDTGTGTGTGTGTPIDFPDIPGCCCPINPETGQRRTVPGELWIEVSSTDCPWFNYSGPFRLNWPYIGQPWVTPCFGIPCSGLIDSEGNPPSPLNCPSESIGLRWMIMLECSEHVVIPGPNECSWVPVLRIGRWEDSYPLDPDRPFPQQDDTCSQMTVGNTGTSLVYTDVEPAGPPSFPSGVRPSLTHCDPFCITARFWGFSGPNNIQYNVECLKYLDEPGYDDPDAGVFISIYDPRFGPCPETGTGTGTGTGSGSGTGAEEWFCWITDDPFLTTQVCSQVWPGEGYDPSPVSGPYTSCEDCLASCIPNEGCI